MLHWCSETSAGGAAATAGARILCWGGGKGKLQRTPHSAFHQLQESVALRGDQAAFTSSVYLLQVMGKNKVLVKVHPEGKYVVDIDKAIDIAQIAVGARVALKNDSYTLHLLLPTKVRAVSSDSPLFDGHTPVT